MRTFRPLFLILTLLVCLRSAEAQAVRFDQISSTTSAQCSPGKQCPLSVLPGTQVNICGGTVTTLASCLGAPATTYTDASAGTPCATTAQLTPQTGGACLATADNQGGYGFWISPGSYSYFLRVPATAGGGTYGPYPISIGASAGCPLGASCDASFATLALACSAAGSGTLYVTRVWNAVPTQTLACDLNFLGNGKIQPASGQIVTLAGGLSGDLTQHFDTSLAGPGSIVISKVDRVYPQWFGALANGSHDDTVALNASYAAIQTGGITLFLPPGDYPCNTLAGPLCWNIRNDHDNVQTPGVNGGAEIAGSGIGRTIISTTLTSGIIMSAVSSGTTNYPFYNIHDLTVQGPDSPNACIFGVGSPTGGGTGINISGSSSVSVRMQNILATGFCGSGGLGILLDQAEGTQWDKVRADYNETGIQIAGVHDDNSSVFNKVEADQNREYGMKWLGAVGQVWNGLLIQSNLKMGLYGSETGAITCNSCWFEHNNFSLTPDKYALMLDSAVAGNNADIFIAPVFAAASDSIYLSGDATPAHTTSGNYFLGISPSGFQAGATVTLANQYATGNIWSGILPSNFMSNPLATESFLDATAAYTSGARHTYFPILNTNNFQAGSTLSPGANFSNMGTWNGTAAGTGVAVGMQELGIPLSTETMMLDTGTPGSGGGVSIFGDGSNFWRMAWAARTTTTIAPPAWGVTTKSGGATWDTRLPTVFANMIGCAGTTFFNGTTGGRAPEGSTASVSDSTTNTWGAVIAGGGSFHVLAYCDGTNWTVVGK